MTLGYKDIEIRKSEFVAKTQLFYNLMLMLDISIMNLIEQILMFTPSCCKD